MLELLLLLLLKLLLLVLLLLELLLLLLLEVLLLLLLLLELLLLLLQGGHGLSAEFGLPTVWHQALLQMGKACHGSLLLVLLLVLLGCDQPMSHKALTLLCQLGGTQHPGLGQKHLSVRTLGAQGSRVLLLLLQHCHLGRAQHALGPLGWLWGQLLDQEARMAAGRQKTLGLGTQSLVCLYAQALLLLLLDRHLS